MKTCRRCTQTFSTWLAYFEHFAYHSSVLAGALCPISSCSVVFKNYQTFRSHIFRHHRKQDGQTGNVAFSCSLPSCGSQESTRTKIVSHIVDHLKNGTESIVCPFTGCVSMLRSAGSFRTHVSRYHKEAKDALVHSDILENDFEMEPVTVSEVALGQPMNVDSGGEPSDSQCRDVDLFTENFALFLLKLQSQQHVPSKTVQFIVGEIKNIHNLSQQIALKEIAKIVPDDMFSEIQSRLTEDPLDTVASVTLRSSYCRQKYYKANLHFVPPVELSLGLNKQNGISIYHYVPIEDVIHFLMCRKPASENRASGDSFHDCPSFIEVEENEVQVILYQDEFEVVNPLGSAKGNFKLLGVYMTLGNLPLHCRSRVESLQLVMLCRQKDVKEFGLSQVLKPLTQDLAALEQSGLLINGVMHTVRLSFIVGDNLGSHAVGGFTQCFSSAAHFCRFCTISRTEFEQKPHALGQERNRENYNASLEQIAGCDTVKIDCGVVGDSPFHVLQHYHVCDSGLPPCIGHDILEGVVQYDLALFIKYFVKKKSWFTYDYLNNRMSSTSYGARDLRNKPAKVPSQGEKLGGHALQNHTLLRLLPLYVGTKVLDTADPVWQLMLILMEIVDFLMAPKITPAQVAYLKVLVEEYITCRMELFPQTKLRPKHHYMVHYSHLIQKFGPLSHVWTMRFEAKHQYFKQCIRSAKNFKNVTKTLAEQHQLYQAFLAARGLFVTPTEFTDMTHADQSKLLSSSAHMSITQDTMLLKKGIVDGWTYMVHDYVLVSGTRFDVVFGKILAVVKNRDEKVLLLLLCTPARLAQTLRLYVLGCPTEDTVLLSPHDLLDAVAYQPYKFDGTSVVRLNCSFPEIL